MLIGEFVLDASTILGAGKLSGDAEDLSIVSFGLNDTGDVDARLLGPLLLGAKGESPALATGIGLADIGEGRDLVSDRNGFGVGLAISAAFRPGGGLQIRADSPLAQLAAKDLEDVGLVTRGDRLKMVFERGRVKLVCRAVGGVRIIFGAQPAHEGRWEHPFMHVRHLFDTRSS